MYGIRGTALRSKGPIHQRGDLIDSCSDWNIEPENDLSNLFLVSSLKSTNRKSRKSQTSRRSTSTQTPTLSNDHRNVASQNSHLSGSHSSDGNRSELFTESVLFEDDVDECSQHITQWEQQYANNELQHELLEDPDIIMQQALNVYQEHRTKELLRPKTRRATKRPQSARVSTKPEPQNTPRPQTSFSSVSLYLHLPTTNDQTPPGYTFNGYRNAHRPNSATKFRSNSERHIVKTHPLSNNGVNTFRLIEKKERTARGHTELLSARSSSSITSSRPVREEVDIDNGVIRAVGVANGIVVRPRSESEIRATSIRRRKPTDGLLGSQLFAMAKKLLPDDGTRARIDGARHKNTTKPSAPYKSDSTFFHSPKHRRDFAVHPDWVSEQLVPKIDQPYPFTVRNKVDTYAPQRGRSMTRRAASANGAKRDPITWRAWPSKQKQVFLPEKVHIANKEHVTFNLTCQNKSPTKRPEYKGPCFARSGTQSRPYFTIHPEWVSENLSVKGMSLNDKKQSHVNHILAPPRRCKSAPPPRSRNPITWQDW